MRSALQKALPSGFMTRRRHDAVYATGPCRKPQPLEFPNHTFLQMHQSSVGAPFPPLVCLSCSYSCTVKPVTHRSLRRGQPRQWQDSDQAHPDFLDNVPLHLCEGPRPNITLRPSMETYRSPVSVPNMTVKQRTGLSPCDRRVCRWCMDEGMATCGWDSPLTNPRQTASGVHHPQAFSRMQNLCVPPPCR